jgi:hypothetical protein
LEDDVMGWKDLPLAPEPDYKKEAMKKLDTFIEELLVADPAGQGLTAGDIIMRSSLRPELREAIKSLHYSWEHRFPSAKSLGRFLANARGRIIRDRQIDRMNPGTKNPARWVVLWSGAPRSLPAHPSDGSVHEATCPLGRAMEWRSR